MRGKRTKYSPTLPALMYTFFTNYDDNSGAPSFSKFARRIGSTVEELEKFRRHTSFDRSWRECDEIRRDYLIDRALTKRFDPSLVKFLLSAEDDSRGAESGDGLLVRIQVED